MSKQPTYQNSTAQFEPLHEDQLTMLQRCMERVISSMGQSIQYIRSASDTSAIDESIQEIISGEPSDEGPSPLYSYQLELTENMNKAKDLAKTLQKRLENIPTKDEMILNLSTMQQENLRLTEEIHELKRHTGTNILASYTRALLHNLESALSKIHDKTTRIYNVFLGIDHEISQ